MRMIGLVTMTMSLKNKRSRLKKKEDRYKKRKIADISARNVAFYRSPDEILPICISGWNGFQQHMEERTTNGWSKDVAVFFNPKIKPGSYQLDFSLIKVIASVCGLILISNIYPREEVKRESVSLALTALQVPYTRF
jgi:hypothetical protein